METGEIHRKQLRRQALLEFFANRQPGLVAMEACGSAHYWGRELRKLGHEVRLVAAQFVRPFVKANKNDAADAAAIWETVQRPDMRFVAVKSEEQRSILALHRMREQSPKSAPCRSIRSVVCTHLPTSYAATWMPQYPLARVHCTNPRHCKAVPDCINDTPAFRQVQTAYAFRHIHLYGGNFCCAHHRRRR